MQFNADADADCSLAGGLVMNSRNAKDGAAQLTLFAPLLSTHFTLQGDCHYCQQLRKLSFPWLFGHLWSSSPAVSDVRLKMATQCAQ